MSLKKTGRQVKRWKKLWTFLRELTRNKLLQRIFDLILVNLVSLPFEMIKEHHNFYH
jgi:hypothetical protein